MRVESERYTPRRAYSTLRSARSHTNSRASVRGPTASCIPFVPNTAPSDVGGLRDARRHRQARALSRATAKVVTRPIVGTLDTRHTPHKPKPEKNEAKRHFGGFRERDGARPRRPESRVPSGGPSALPVRAAAECLLETAMLKGTGGTPGPPVE